ncbi:MAG: hypothetical protein HKL84_05630 [Acidimicrobiaceae bacterium]|nr:hypothetical protein [Acidimicrobiaceae bacterium]
MRAGGVRRRVRQIHRSVNFPQKVALSLLVNNLKGVSVRRVRLEFSDVRRQYWKANQFWQASKVAESVGGIPPISSPNT